MMLDWGYSISPPRQTALTLARINSAAEQKPAIAPSCQVSLAPVLVASDLLAFLPPSLPPSLPRQPFPEVAYFHHVLHCGWLDCDSQVSTVPFLLPDLLKYLRQRPKVDLIELPQQPLFMAQQTIQASPSHTLGQRSLRTRPQEPTRRIAA